MGGVLAYAWGVSFVLPYLFLVGKGEAAKAGAVGIPSIAVNVLGDLVLAAGTLIGASLMLLFKSIALGFASFFMAMAVLLLCFAGVSHNAWSGWIIRGAAAILGAGVFHYAHRNKKKNQRNVNVFVTSAFGALLLVCGSGNFGAKDLLIQDLTALCTFDYAAIGRCGRHDQGTCRPFFALLSWVVGSMLAVVVQLYLGADPELKQKLLGFFQSDRRGYTSVPDGKAQSTTKLGPAAVGKHQRQESINNKPAPEDLGVNILDLRHSLDAEGGAHPTMDKEERQLCVSLLNMFDEMQGVFGFQTHSGVNQVEHLVLLLKNQKRYQDPAFQTLIPGGKGPLSSDVGTQTPVDVLHDKMFKNYKQWCETLKVQPHFNTIPGIVPRAAPMPGAGRVGEKWFDTDAAKVKMHNLLLLLLIWGEAGNIRHMPECLAWLYHTSAACFRGSTHQTLENVEEEYFLTNAVTPIYKVIAVDMQKKKDLDHLDKKNYDDFNEFFWSRQCLEYTWTPADMPAVQAARAKNARGGYGSADEEEGKKPTLALIGEGLKKAPKTFIEKRSWFMIMLAFRRLIDFHVVTFFLLAMQGFWLNLQWDNPYYFQMMSAVFLLTNCLGIVWSILEIWTALQAETNPCAAFKTRREAKHGVMLRLLTRFVFLFFQVKFYGLSLEGGGLDLKPAQHLSAKSVQLENWWMYVWISVALHTVWFIECAFQCWPYLSTLVFECRNHYVKALLDIIFPQSRNYTGKRVHEPFKKWLVYSSFWFFVVTVKILFSYQFEVTPLALPALELADDQVNFLDQNLYLTIVLIVVRWLPFVAIYMLDMIIIYSLAAGVMGLVVGLIEKLGQVRDFAGIRDNFMRTPESFFSRLIFNADDTRNKRSRKASAVSDLGMPRRFTASRNDLLAAAADAEERQPLVATLNAGMQRLGNGTPNSGAGGARPYYQSVSSGDAFMDVGTTKWRAFSTAWNKVVLNLRATDIINNDERDMLLFHFFTGFTKDIYLPVFQTAGSVERAVRLCGEKGKEFRALAEKGKELRALADQAELQMQVDQHQPHHQHQQQQQHPYKKAIDNNRAEMTKVNSALWSDLSADRTMHEAVAETLELSLEFLVRMLGEDHVANVNKVKMTMERLQEGTKRGDVEAGGQGQGQGGETELILEGIKLEEVAQAVGALGKMVTALKGGLPRRVINPNRVKPAKQTPTAREGRGTVTVGSAMKKVRSRGFMSNLSLSSQNLVEVGEQAEGQASPPTPTASSQTQHELDSLRDKVREALRGFLGAVKKMLEPGPLFKDVGDAVDKILNGQFFWCDVYASDSLDALVKPEMKEVVHKILAKLQGLLTLHVGDAEPKSAEARRRLTFFVNSLFMDVPKAPSIGNMLSWTVVTPFYSEDVLYSKKDLDAANEDGVKTLLYLQTLYKSDWKNFQERLSLRDDSPIWTGKVREELRLWASMRAQTLSRTVQGMMYYEDALHVLSELDHDAPVVDPEANSTDQLIQRKFGYVVACQVYGKLKKEQDSKADDIDFLLRKFPNLRVAYIDEKQSKSGESYFYSVLIRAAEDKKTIEEIYRVRLPGNPILGEGKPENQNHAMIFSRGEHVQAIDMNQEGYFEDAFKMRNFLQEFAVTGTPDMPTTILGFREHIFTGAVSSLANYMALQEYSFVTLGQRVLNRPLRMRLHYGHPDLFDKLFFMQNGGISKASKGINLSEDIFAGYNNLLRGGSVEFKEYVQVGKGRDVGMQQIYKFEAKLSQGAAEQSISRDVSRMLGRVDFFRLLSYYFGGIGHYLSSVLTVAAIWLLVYLLLGLALFQHEKIGDRPMVPIGTLQVALAGVGLLQTAPLFCALLLERGIWAALTELAQVFISGGPLYFVFHIRTRDYYYTQTILAGGAAYRATGRGFVTQHASFAETFRFFAMSHLYLGLEMIAALILFACFTDVGQYVGRTWSLWFAALAFLYAPFWFNPMSFEWERVREDMVTFEAWMRTTGGSATNSWETWWKEENKWVKQLKDVSARLYLVARSSIWLMVAAGLLYKPIIVDGKMEQLTFLLEHLVVLSILFACNNWLEGRSRSRDYQGHYAIIRGLMFLLAIMAVVAFIATATHTETFKFLVALYYIAAWCSTVMYVSTNRADDLVKAFHKAHDWLLATCCFIPIGICTLIQFPRFIQTWLLYHNALSQGVVISDLISYASNSRETTHTNDERAEASSLASGSATSRSSTPFLVSAAPKTTAAATASAATTVESLQISPEEKPAERIVEIEGLGGGGGHSILSPAGTKKKNGKNGAVAKTAPGSPRRASAQEAQEPSAATAAAAAPNANASAGSVESFQFRQPTNFPTRE
jgi:callose synthase